VTTWLHRIVENACLDRLRRRKVRLADPLPDDLGERGPVAGTAENPTLVDPAQLAVDHERRAALFAALATLPLDQRAALVLVDMEGYSVEETAQILHCAPGTVKSRCSRGRARLLPLLTEFAPGHGPGHSPGHSSGHSPGHTGGNPRAAPRVPPAEDPARDDPAGPTKEVSSP
jgi:RNA polymerase sigma-70 factor (ECF subfamily)